MNKIGIIFKREFSTRIKNRAFILMTILGPLLITAILVLPMWIQKQQEKAIKTIAIIDETNLLYETIEDFQNYRFVKLDNVSVDDLKDNFANSGYNAILFIPKNIYASKTIGFYSSVIITDALKAYTSYVLRRDLEYLALLQEKVSVETIKRVKRPLIVQIENWSEDGNFIEDESIITSKTGLAVSLGTLLYFFIFVYGVLVLRGVLEEKTTRVVEIIVSSVKPIQLMFGKILGIGSVGLIQFLVWVTITIGLMYSAQLYLFPEAFTTSKIPEIGQMLGEAEAIKQITSNESETTVYAFDIFKKLQDIDWGVMIPTFIILFLLGYFLYATIFAAIGSIISQDTDSQQFVLPVSLPLIFSLIMLQSIIANPNGDIAFWLSMCPFTSPIIMLARVPFGVPYWELTLSIGILIVSCYLMGWVASKMYRAGILHYGKKMSFKAVISIFKK